MQKIDTGPPKLASVTFINLTSERDIFSNVRDDAKLFVDVLLAHGIKTAAIKLRIYYFTASCSTVIKLEVQDLQKLRTFTLKQKKKGYDRAQSSGSKVTLSMLVALTSEADSELAEIGGLEIVDIDTPE